MIGDHSGRIDIDQNPCNPAINIHLAPGQQSPGISIFDALGNLVQSFPVTIPPPVSLSSAVILAPNTSTRNTIQPTANANSALILQRFSGILTGAPLLQWNDQTGAELGQILPAGGIGVGTNPLTALNWYNGAGTFSSPTLAVGMTGGVGSGVSFSTLDQNGMIQFICGGTGGGPGFSSIQAYCNDDAQVGYSVLRHSPAQSADIQQVLSDDGLTVLQGTAGPDGHLYFGQLTSDSSAKKLTEFPFGFVNNLAATFTSRQRLLVYDFGGSREIWRGESNGTAPMIGFLGAGAIVRPSSTTDLRQALINLGLYTTGGATPLNLNGGAFQASTISDLVRDAATSITTQMILLTHQSTGTPLAGFGSHIEFALDDNANVNRRGGKVSVEWVTPTSGSTVSSTTLHAAKGNSFVPCLVADGNQQVTIPGNFFHNGIVGTNQIGFFQIGPVGQQANASQTAITAVLDANAKSALQAIYNLLKNYGLAPATA